MIPMQRISIIGTGYVGLSTAVCFASRGYHVIAATQNKEKAQAINEQRAPFYEPRLFDRNSYAPKQVAPKRCPKLT